MQQHNQGNNEQLATGMTQQHDGSWLALTRTESREFKTERGAERWLARRGYNRDGSKN